MSKRKLKYAPEPIRTYAPTPEMRKASTALLGRLERVMYPKRSRRESPVDMPPGRLVASRAIQRDAQRKAGMIPTAKPFTRRTLEKAVRTTITTGYMFDGSASQEYVQETVGVTRWIFTDALLRTHGRLAAVQFGERGLPVQAPGESLSEVEIYGAYDGWENFVEGFSLIDGALNLIDGDGARLLFIVTDGRFNDKQAITYAEEVMAMCRENNVAVVWIDSGAGFARPDAYGHGRIIEVRDLSPIQVANLLGDAIIEQFRSVAPQHSLRTVA